MFKKWNTYKKTLLNILYIYIGFSLLIVVNIYASFQWSGDNIDANSSVVNDVWSMTWTVTSTVWDPLASNSWEIILTSLNSQLFWDFIKKSWNIYLQNSLSSKCWAWKITYDILWNFRIISNEFWINKWWEMDIDQWVSYYCPWLNKMNIIFNSVTLWDKFIWWDAGILWIIFNASEVSIKWLADVRWNLNNLSDDVVKRQEILNISSSSVEWKLVDVTKTINKNITLATKQKNWITTGATISVFNNTSNEDKYYYYDYEWQIGTNNTIWNEWKNLIINNGWTLLTNQVWVTWKNTVIVKWWNIYINADIYNNDNTDLLVLIAKRDSTNNQNWGNIYVDPSITNIDAVLIAEWSLISYDWTNVLNSQVNSISLFRQLLIYWSVITRNTIWEDISVYWSDEYIANSWISTSSKYYNLANFRSPTLAYASFNASDDCWWDGSRVIIGTSSSPVKNAWAWKRECFYNYIVGDNINNKGLANLRTVEWKVNPLVIEYNSNIKNINPFILKSN